MPYICLNGSFEDENTSVIHHTNRSFCFGDAIFETIKANGTNLLFFDDHYNRIEKGLTLLKIEQTEDISKNNIKKHIEKLLHKNKYYTGTRVRLTIFRNSKGIGYKPYDNTPGFLIETKQLDHSDYSLNPKGKRIGVYTDIHKPNLPFSSVKCVNSLVYVMASIYCKENNLDDCLLVNEKKALLEATSSNLFIVKDHNIYTPPLSDGCVEGTMRKKIINIAVSKGIQVTDNKSLPINTLMNADEVFLTNAIRGISWVVAFQNKRYYHTIAKKLIEALNLKARDSQE